MKCGILKMNALLMFYDTNICINVCVTRPVRDKQAFQMFSSIKTRPQLIKLLLDFCSFNV